MRFQLDGRYLTVGELRALISTCSDETLVVLASSPLLKEPDQNGELPNRCSPVVEIATGYMDLGKRDHNFTTPLMEEHVPCTALCLFPAD